MRIWGEAGRTASLPQPSGCFWDHPQPIDAMRLISRGLLGLCNRARGKFLTSLWSYCKTDITVMWRSGIIRHERRCGRGHGHPQRECRAEAVQGLIVRCLIQHNTAVKGQSAGSSRGTHPGRPGQKCFTLGLKWVHISCLILCAKSSLELQCMASKGFKPMLYVPRTSYLNSYNYYFKMRFF